MYGMIHKSVRDMIVAEFGEQQWEKVAEAAGIGDEHLLSLEVYDDDIIYRMVSIAAEMFDLTTEEVLKSFGRHFVVNTLPLAYQSMIETYGRSSFELLSNINRLHDNIKSTFTGYRPPSFLVESISDNSIDIIYESERSGLSPFVVGLILGLSEYFHESLVIEEMCPLATVNGEKTRFRIINEQTDR